MHAKGSPLKFFMSLIFSKKVMSKISFFLYLRASLAFLYIYGAQSNGHERIPDHCEQRV